MIAKRRPVAEPCHQHVQVGTENRGPTHLRRLLVPRGEVLHVHDRVTRMQYSGVGRLDVRAVLPAGNRRNSDVCGKKHAANGAP